MHILVVKHKYAIAVKKAMYPLKDVNRNPTNTVYFLLSKPITLFRRYAVIFFWMQNY